MVKTEAGALPEGKVRIKLEHDGTVLDVDEDDVEKVGGTGRAPYLFFPFSDAQTAFILSHLFFSSQPKLAASQHLVLVYSTSLQTDISDEMLD